MITNKQLPKTLLSMELSKCLACLCFLYIHKLEYTETKKNKKDTDRSKAIYKTNFRLKGQFGENTGIVAVKPHWGAVCAERFTDHDARVVCREILDTDHVYFSKLRITNPASYGFDRLMWYIQLGCQHKSTSLQSCNAKLVSVGSTYRCDFAAVCCKNNTEKGVYSEDRASYTTNCPYKWDTAKKLICYTGYNNIKYNDTRSIHIINSSWLWTSSRIETFEMNSSLCENKMSGFLEKDNIQNCSSIYQSCLRKEKQYFLKQGNNCSCLNDDEVCHNGTDMLHTENCTDEDTSPLCGYQIFRMNVTEEGDSNSSTCIQVRFKDGEKRYSVEDCGMIRQTACLKNDICSSQPCVNSGSCIPNEDGTKFSCKCVLNYVKPHCYKDACIPNPCNRTFESCKVNENRTSHICGAHDNRIVAILMSNSYNICLYEEGRKNINVSTSTVRYSTKQQSSEKDEKRTDIIVIALSLILAVAMLSCVAYFIFRRKVRRRKGEPGRPNSMANQTYGIRSCEELEVYDFIDDAKLDPNNHTPLSRRKPVEVIALDDYSMPSDALGDASEYAETYDETKLIRYQREQSEMKHKVEEVIIDTRNANAYFVLEKEESESKQEDDNYNIGAIDKDDGTQDKLKRVSSYEDTDNCIQGAKRSEKIDDSGYEITSGVKKELNKNRPANLERNNLFAKGLDHIPDSIQRKLGIRFVSGDYSEYYAYKLLRRNSTDCPHCENKDLCESSYESFGHLPKSTLDADISEENNDSINEYDKLHYFARNDSKQQNRYDRVLGNFIKGGTLGNQVISGTARYEKRSNSI